MGWRTYHFDEAGGLIESDLSRLTPGRKGVIRCAGCNEVRRDLSLVEMKVVPNGKRESA